MTGPALAVAMAAAAALAAWGTAAADDADGPRLLPGAVELGISGSLVSSGVAGRASTLAVRAAALRGAGPGLATVGAEVAYRHVGNLGDLDQVRATAHVGWTAPLAASSAYPFASVWAGIDHDRVGSFRQTRTPIGTGVGIRALVSRGAAVHVEYRYARVRDPDVSDFNEHEILTGVTLLLRNRP